MNASTLMPIVNIVMMMMLSDKPFNSQMVVTLLAIMAPQFIPAFIQWCKSLVPKTSYYTMKFQSHITPQVFRAVSVAAQKNVKDSLSHVIVGSCKTKVTSGSLVKNDCHAKYMESPISCPDGSFSFQYSGIKVEGNMSVEFDAKITRMSLVLGVPKQHTATLKKFVEDAIKDDWGRLYSKLGSSESKVLLTWKQFRKRWHPAQLSVNKTFDNLWLSPELTRAITDDLDAFRGATSFYEKRGMPHKRGMLFYGPPGTGKTSCIFAISHYLQYDVYRISLRMVISEVQHALRKIKQAAIIVIEEVDLALSIPNMSGPKEEDDVTPSKSTMHDSEKLALLMEYLDGYVSHTPGAVIIFTTNHKEDIPKALIRPGRIDRHFYFPPLHGVDVARVARNFTEMPDLECPEGVTIPAADLINTVLLPHIGDREALQQQLTGLHSTHSVTSCE